MKSLLMGMVFICYMWFLLPCHALGEPSKELQNWQRTGSYFSYNQYKLFYRDSNNSAKETIVLLHGFPTSSWDWHVLWHSLKGDYRVIALDLLGFGFSDKPKDIDYSIAEQADIVESLLSHLRVDDAHFIVHDYGTFVAQELMARKPQPPGEKKVEIKSLAILNGPTSPEELKLRLIQKALKSPIGGAAARLSTAFVFNMTFSPIFGPETKPSKQDLNDDWHVIKQQKGNQICHKLMHYYKESFQNRDRWMRALQNTEAPIIMIWGESDPVVGKSTVDKFREMMPHSRVVTLAKIGHYPQVEAPKQVLYFYKDFLNSVKLNN